MHLHKMQPTTIIKTPTALNTGVPSSGDCETNLYQPNPPQYSYYTTHVEKLKMLKLKKYIKIGKYKY
jgi:hypothetical protein